MKRFNDLKVGTKVLSACIIFLIIITIIVIDANSRFGTSYKLFKTFYFDNFIPGIRLNKTYKDLLQMKYNMLEAEKALKTGINKSSKKIMSSGNNNNENERKWDTFISTGMTTEERMLAEKISKDYEILSGLENEYLKSLDNNDYNKSDEISGKWDKLYPEIKYSLDKLINMREVNEEQIINQYTETRSSIRIFYSALIVLSIIISIIIVYLLRSAVSKPLNQVLKFAEMISEGDFTGRIDLMQKDEFGQISYALNVAVGKIEDLIKKIIMGTQSLAQAVEQIAGGNQNLSQRTSEQASSLQEIAATIEQTTVTIGQNADNAEDADRQSKETLEMAAEGRRIAYEAVVSINDINRASKKIEEIISMINEIAFQTNLLALNASVEAARAGEQGRGFAVVAGEVRNLAQRASVSAKEIGSLIKDSTGRIESGTSLVNKTGEALKEISESLSRVGNLISEITTASLEQKQGIEQINSSVSGLDSMTQQNAALVEETASASEEMTNQAQDLLSIVEKFKVKDTSKNKSFQNNKIDTKVIHRQKNLSKNKMTDVLTEDEKRKINQIAEKNKEEAGETDLGKVANDEAFKDF